MRFLLTFLMFVFLVAVLGGGAILVLHRSNMVSFLTPEALTVMNDFLSAPFLLGGIILFSAMHIASALDGVASSIDHK